MFTFLGVLCLIIAGVLYFLKSYNKSIIQDNEDIIAFNKAEDDSYYHKKLKTSLFQPNIKTIIPFILGVVFLLFGIVNPIASNSYGYRQVVENRLTGNTWVQFDQGIYFKGFGSKTTTYPNVITVKYAKPNTIEELGVDEEITSLNLPAEIRFSDAADADAEATVKFRLSNREDQMLLTHKDNRTYKKLTQTILEPYADECLNFAAQLMESTGSLG